MTVSTGAPDALQFEVNGLVLAAEAYGPVDGVPVLALHGWLDNAASFAYLAPKLVGCRVVALDQRGHGLSSHLKQPYQIWDGVPDVISVLEQLGWDSVILLGHSMGAAVAALTASAFPERVGHLWLIDGFGPWTYPDSEAPDLLRSSTERLLALAHRKTPCYDAFEEGLRARVMGGVVPLTEAAALPIVTRGLKQTTDGWRWTADQYLTLPAQFRMDEAQIQAFIRRLSMPVSLALGSAGLFSRPTFLEDRIALCEHIRVETFPGGHHLHLEGAEGAIALWLIESLERA